MVTNDSGKSELAESCFRQSARSGPPEKKARSSEPGRSALNEAVNLSIDPVAVWLSYRVLITAE